MKILLNFLLEKNSLADYLNISGGEYSGIHTVLSAISVIIQEYQESTISLASYDEYVPRKNFHQILVIKIVTTICC